MKWTELVPEATGGLVIRPGAQAEILIAPGTPENPPWEPVEGRYGQRWRINVWVVAGGKPDIKTVWYCGKRALQQIAAIADMAPDVIPAQPTDRHQSLLVSRLGDGLQTQYIITPSGRYYKTPG
jgi:hypothetical protein